MTTARASAEVTDEADRLYVEQLKLLHSNALVALLATLLTAAILCLVLWTYADYRVLGAWFTALLAVIVLRYRHAYRFHRVFDSRREAHRWGGGFIFWTGLTAAVWGATAVLFFPGLPIQYQMFLTFLIGVMGAGAIVTYAAMFEATALFVFPSTVPLIVQMFVQGGAPLVQMGWLSVLYLLIVMLLARRMSGTTLRALRLGLDNTELIDYLVRAKQNADDLNRNLEREIGERERVEAKLRVERDFIAAILDTEAALVVVLHDDGAIARVNRVCEMVTGYSGAALQHRPIWDLAPNADERQEFRAIMENRAWERGPVQHEARWVTQGGGYALIRWSITATRNPELPAEYLIATGIDQTAWRRTESALDETRENLRLRDRAIASSSNAILIVQAAEDTQLIRYANPAVAGILGYAPAEIVGRDWLFWRHEGDGELESLRMAVRFSREAHLDVQYQRRDGSHGWAEIFIAPVRDETPDRQHCVVVMNDITDRMTAELEVKQSREQLRELSKHLQTVREDEKAQIAREIHDELGSTLTKLKLDLSWLTRRLDPQTGDLRDMTSTMLGLVDSAVGTTRRIATNLRPPILDDLGLAAAIEWQAGEFQKRMGVRCHLELSVDADNLGSEHSIALFRILQEAFTNISRHAQATDVHVALGEQPGAIVLQVRDNGVGIAPNAARRAGSSGVYGMIERAKSLGGNLTLEGEPGKGTTLTVTLPYEASHTEVKEP